LKRQSTEKPKQLVDQTYMEALIELRQLIAQEYANGGWLPSGRIMCSRLNVNRITYAKSLSRLIDEGLAQNYPRKGTYIKPNALRIQKVGIIIGMGEDSPFLSMPYLLLEITDELLKHNISIQLIQANQPENLFKKAMFHCVNSLLWIYSQSTALPIAENIHKSGKMPILAVRHFDPKNNEDIASGIIPLVSLDYQTIGTERAKQLLADGHRRIAYAGSHWFAEFTGFGAALREAGIAFDESFCFSDGDNILGRLATFIEQEKITAVFSEGDFMENVFQVIDKLPAKIQPELYLRHLKENALHNIYTNVKAIKVEHVQADLLGKKAAETMADYLHNGTPLTSVAVTPHYNVYKL